MVGTDTSVLTDAWRATLGVNDSVAVTLKVTRTFSSVHTVHCSGLPFGHAPLGGSDE
jgi:hypothetical protein